MKRGPGNLGSAENEAKAAVSPLRVMLFLLLCGGFAALILSTDLVAQAKESLPMGDKAILMDSTQGTTMTTTTTRGRSEILYSSVECRGPCCEPGFRNRTCRYRNLYLKEDGTMNYFGEPGKPLPRNVDLLVYSMSRTWSPDPLPRVAVATAADEVAMQGAHELRGPSVTLEGVDANIAHCQMDLIHPPFQQLLQWESTESVLREGGNWTWVRSRETQAQGIANAARCYQFAEILSGQPILWGAEGAGRGWQRLSHHYAGGGTAGLSTYDRRYSSCCHEENSVSRFRDRLQQQLKKKTPLENNKHWRGKERRARVVWAHNKRPYEVDWKVVKELILPDATFEEVRWEQLDMEGQVALLASTDVFITGIGSSQINMAFLRDGATVVVLPWLLAAHGRQQSTYLDDYFASASSHVRVLYYPFYLPDEQGPGPSVRPRPALLARLVHHALSLQSAPGGVQLPVSIRRNQNAQGRACARIFAADESVWLRASGQLRPGRLLVRPSPDVGLDPGSETEMACVGPCARLLYLVGWSQTGPCFINVTRVHLEQQRAAAEDAQWRAYLEGPDNNITGPEF